jgi:hypothetical protein
VGVFFQFNTKDFGTYHDIVATKMDTSHVSPIQGNTPEAYERLIFDILRGDSTLFSRWDEVEASWMFADKIIEYIDALGIERSQPNHDTHKILLGAEIVILEGLRLKEVEEGEYLLVAAPINVVGAEAAPVRAILIGDLS